MGPEKEKDDRPAVEEEICDSCHGALGDDAPLYEDADICRTCHNEIQAAAAVRP